MTESFGWQHGTFLGAIVSSETTAAAAGKVGELRRDPMAMLAFCGYNMGDYFAHYLKIGQKPGARLPAFGKQALQVVWDFAEVNPLSDGPANWSGAVDWVLKVVEANLCLNEPGTVVRGRAQDRILPADSADALVTDPPYFAAIPYGDLSNVFFVWERTFFQAEFPELFKEGLVDQRDEIVVTNANLDSAGAAKDTDFYRREMVRALEAAHVSVKPQGIGVIVFAESSTSLGKPCSVQSWILVGWSADHGQSIRSFKAERRRLGQRRCSLPFTSYAALVTILMHVCGRMTSAIGVTFCKHSPLASTNGCRV